MIVSMNKNPDKYSNLFIEAKDFLGLSDNINSLAEYYGHMADFFGKQGYRFVMLPLDEDPFTIDLNNRTIIVPASFNKCASLQNDQLAETIVFVTDRYFDYMDLANTQIYVQWTIPADPKNNRNQAIEGATFVEMRDLESEPGKLRFAWPLNKEITQYAGNVKFSVRFVRLDNNKKVLYSLNTLESSLVIKPALQPEMTDSLMVESPVDNDAFVNVIINSLFATEGVDLPLQPSYATPGSNIVALNRNADTGDWTVVPLTEAVNVLGNPKIANLQNDTLTLGVQAFTADLGKIIYDWYYRANTYIKVMQSDAYADNRFYYKKVNDATFEPLHVTRSNYATFAEEIKNENVYYVTVTQLTKKEDPDTQKFAYVKCNPTEKVPGKRFYKLVSGSGDSAAYTDVAQDDKFPDKTVQYFEKYSIYTIAPGTTNSDGVYEGAPVTGRYYADAWNAIPVDGKEDIVTLNGTRSADCYLPGPSDIAFEKDGNLDVAAIMENGRAELSVDLVDDKYGAVPQYTWSKKTTENGAFSPITGETSAAMLAQQPGWYKVDIKSVFNREEKTGTSVVCKVTNLPVPPKVKSQEEATVNLNTDNAIFKVELDASVNTTDKLLTEGFEGIWQIQPADAKEFTTIGENYPGVTISTTNFLNDTIKITKDLKFNSAAFRCLVTNTLHKGTPFEKVAVFDHVNKGQVAPEIGTFEMAEPYIYTPDDIEKGPKSKDSFYFATYKI